MSETPQPQPETPVAGTPQKSGWPTSAKSTVGILAVVATAAIVFAVAGSGNSNSSPNGSPDATASADDSGVVVDEGAVDGEASTTEPHQFGESIDLRGSGTTTSVTPEKYFKTLQVDAYGDVEDHQKLVGIMLSVKNQGGKVAEISPGNDVLLIDSNSGQWETNYETPASGSSCTPDLESQNLPPGAERRGCVTFTVPKKVTPTSIQIQLDSGYGPDLAIWDIPGD